MKTVYIAARFGLKDEVKNMQKQLHELGYETIADWTDHQLIKPYEKNVGLSKEYAIEDIDAAKDCDIFILMSDDSGTGMYVELGAAIASHTEKGTPKIYVVGENKSRSMFYFHPSVNRIDTFDEVLEDVKDK